MQENEAYMYTHYFVFGVYFLPILGAVLADGFLGKYWTILSLSIVYCLGNLTLACMASAWGIAVGQRTMLAVGLFNSIMFPTIFSLGVAELGPLTGNGSGLLNMAIVGGAILPVLQGAIADRFGLHHGFWLPVICYLYILFFAWSGSKPNSERKLAEQER